MVFDLANQNGGVCQIDFEECLADFMLTQYNVEGDDESIEQIAKIMMNVRKELTTTAWADQTLWSPELLKLREFNERMKAKQPMMKQHLDA